VTAASSHYRPCTDYSDYSESSGSGSRPTDRQVSLQCYLAMSLHPYNTHDRLSCRRQYTPLCTLRVMSLVCLSVCPSACVCVCTLLPARATLSSIDIAEIHLALQNLPTCLAQSCNASSLLNIITNSGCDLIRPKSSQAYVHVYVKCKC